MAEFISLNTTGLVTFVISTMLMPQLRTCFQYFFESNYFPFEMPNSIKKREKIYLHGMKIVAYLVALPFGLPILWDSFINLDTPVSKWNIQILYNAVIGYILCTAFYMFDMYRMPIAVSLELDIGADGKPKKS